MVFQIVGNIGCPSLRPFSLTQPVAATYVSLACQIELPCPAPAHVKRLSGQDRLLVSGGDPGRHFSFTSVASCRFHPILLLCSIAVGSATFPKGIFLLGVVKRVVKEDFASGFLGKQTDEILQNVTFQGAPNANFQAQLFHHLSNVNILCTYIDFEICLAMWIHFQHYLTQGEGYRPASRFPVF